MFAAQTKFNRRELMKKLAIVPVVLAMMMSACGGGAKEEASSTASAPSSPAATETPAAAAAPTSTADYDPKRGEGKFDKVELAASLNQDMAAEGEKVAGVKCLSCHKPTDEKLVGPGWKGVTGRRQPEWIMNFITNPDPMIDKDPAVQAQLEICLVRMPNQGLTDEEARSI